eukprot:4400001-Pyramimonas_sp.AAC.1
MIILPREKVCACIPSLQKFNECIRIMRMDRPAPRPVLGGWELNGAQGNFERTSIEHRLGHIAFCRTPVLSVHD